MITTQVLVSTPSSMSLAPRPGLKPKPLAERQSLYSLQLVHYDPIIISASTDGLLAQFKANTPTKLDSNSNSHNIHRRSYTREQKLAAVGYITTKQV
jgi:hypothetical protein